MKENMDSPKEKIINGIKYTYDPKTETYLPFLEEYEEEPVMIGRFGKMREKYLKEHYPAIYSKMLLMGELTDHLVSIDDQAWEMEQQIMKQLAEADGLTDEMKDTDQLRWVGLMNNYRQSAQEIIIKELIEV